MARIDITKTELVWPGKYNADGTLKEAPRVNLPFQVIETVNESRATREATRGGVQTSLFDIYEGSEGDTFEEGWKNKLIWGDNLLVMGSLLEKFAGKIDLIYIDPPFATGADFSFSTPIGQSGTELFKEQSLIEEKAYRDTWRNGTDSFIVMICERLRLMRDLLAANGTIFVHCDWRVSALIRLALDELFGRENHLNQIQWHFRRWPTPAREWQKMHNTIYVYTKCKGSHVFNKEFRERSEETRKRWGRSKIVASHDESGTRVPSDYGKGESPGAPLDDIWDIPIIAPVANERVGFPTQKPEALLHRIIETSSNTGSLVADFFCGSGTTLAVAEKLGRRWLGCDLGRWGIHLTRKRLLGIENCKPFEVLNLGKYERQYWQGVTFGESKDKPITERALYEYLAFVLKLYGAAPVAGMTHLHGRKDKAMVHIGAVEAPVTIDEIDAAIEECLRLTQKNLHVLGWEWEMGLYDLMVTAARNKGVTLLLLQIPREVMEQQAVDKGDVRFFELAYLQAKIESKNLTVEVALEDFVIPNSELIPDEVRDKVKKWSDYIDYWAIDWDFQNDTFMQGWVAYRTRKQRKLPLFSDPHNYEKPGKYRVLIKVIDIFGNDTSQAFDVDVK